VDGREGGENVETKRLRGGLHKGNNYSDNLDTQRRSSKKIECEKRRTTRKDLISAKRFRSWLQRANGELYYDPKKRDGLT